MNNKNEICRIIDANINRASEALRTLEEWARFSRNNQELTTKLKNIRHKLNQIAKEHPNLILNRESDHDIGKNISNQSEKKTVQDIIRSSSKRLQEALRVITEYGKLLEIDSLDLMRFDSYTIEKELVKSDRLIRLDNSKLYLVTNREKFCSDKDFLLTIQKAIEGGVDIVQLREKNTSETKIIELAKEIKNLTANTETLFIINDRVDLALLCDADGVHLGQNDIPIAEARKITPEGFLIGLSTHSNDQGKLGNVSGADYLGVGPVYETPTKPDYTPVGLQYVQWAQDNISIPWFAIGGINESNINEIISNGANRVAIVRAIMNSSTPKETSKQVKSTLLKKELAHAKA